MKEFKPKLTREQCLFAVRHDWNAGQIMARSGIYLTVEDVRLAMDYHGIAYTERKQNHCVDRRPTEGNSYDGGHAAKFSSRVIKVGTHRLRGGLHGN